MFVRVKKHSSLFSDITKNSLKKHYNIDHCITKEESTEVFTKLYWLKKWLVVSHCWSEIQENRVKGKHQGAYTGKRLGADQGQGVCE